MPKINAAGLLLLKTFEGCELHAYQDEGGVWTIGFGHTGDVEPNEVITEAEAEALLIGDLERFEQRVNALAAVDLTPNEFSALVSFEYNTGALDGSTLLQLVNEGATFPAAAQFERWVYVGGAILEGLVRRRAAEKALFLQPEAKT